MAILKPKIYYQMPGAPPTYPPALSPQAASPAPFVPGPQPPTLTQPATPSVLAVAPTGSMDLNYRPSSGLPDNQAWTTYQDARFGSPPEPSSFGQLGRSPFPTRGAAPTSATVRTDNELGSFFTGWADTQQQLISELAKTNIDDTAAGNAFYEFQQQGAGAGLGANAQPLQDMGAWSSAIRNNGAFSSNGQTYDLSAYLAPQKAAIEQGLNGTIGSIQSNLAARQTDHQRAMADRQQNQTRQQQAYNSMAGNGGPNGLLTSAYSQPGFNQVTGQPAPPSFGSLTAGSGTFDPATQSGVFGSINPTARRWNL